MQKANEIRNALENIKYYSQRVKSLTIEQFNIDMAIPRMDTDVGHTRFRCFEGIISSCGGLETYCIGIDNNLKNAEKQDAELEFEEAEE